MDTSKGLDNIDGVVWFDGQYVDWKDAKVHVLTHTLHYGLGVFEGVRAYSTTQGPTIFRLKDHTDRLFESAETVKLKIFFHSVMLRPIVRKIESNKNTNTEMIKI